MSQKTEDKAKPNRPNAVVENHVNHGVGEDVQSINGIEPDDELSGSMKARKRYADVASAAQAAFESAAQAALAARAAVELSKPEPNDSGSDDQSSPGSRGRNIYENRVDRPLRTRSGYGAATTVKAKHISDGSSKFEMIQPIQHSSSESEGEEPFFESENIPPGRFEGKHKEKLERSASSASSLDSAGTMDEAGGMTPSEKAIHFDNSDEETEKDWARIPSKPNESHLDGDSILLKEVNTRKAGYGLGKNYAVLGGEQSDDNEGINHHYSNRNRKIRIRSQADSINMQHEVNRKMGPVLENDGNAVEYSFERQVQRSEMGKKPISMRTRRGY